jgi:hypothetical protein
MRLEPLSNILKQLMVMLRMEMKDKGECDFYFKNLTLPLNIRVGTFLNSTSKAKAPTEMGDEGTGIRL